MKKVLLITFVVIVIPFFVVNFLNNNAEIKFKYASNIYVRVKDVASGAISNVAFEDYIAGVLAGEMPISFEIEALKAQAVAARSYVMKQMLSNKDKDYDVVNTVANQVYLSDEYLKSVWSDEYTSKMKKIQRAISETHNEYLDYNGTVAEAMFFSTSVGYTENSEEIFSSKVPYLRSVASTWDEISPMYTVKSTIDLVDFYEKLGLTYSNKIQIEIISHTSTGRINKLKINNTIFDSSVVVEKLNLKSNFFEITQSDNKVIIVTKGYGHGVGMSQYGAQAMALKGYKYDDILAYYYTGTVIKKI